MCEFQKTRVGWKICETAHFRLGNEMESLVKFKKFLLNRNLFSLHTKICHVLRSYLHLVQSMNHVSLLLFLSKIVSVI